MDFTRQAQVPLIGALARGFAAPTASFTRPTDTTAYAVGDLVANSVTAGLVAPLSLTVGRVTAPWGRIKRVRLSKTTTVLTAAAFRAHFYAVSPTPANGDNAAWSTDQAATYVGAVGVTMDKAFTDGAFGMADCEIAYIAAAQTLYALIEAAAPYSPGNAEVFTLAADIEQD